MKSGDAKSVVEWLELEGISGSDSSSSGTLREFDKIYVIINCFFEYERKAECWVYCADVNSSSSSDITTGCVQLLNPIIRWSQPDLGFHAYVILGSMLYMFGRPVKGGSFFGEGFFYYDMKNSSENPPCLYLLKESLIQGEPMAASKQEPVAVVIGDSKICVFATLLATEDNWKPSFELLDTKNLTWKSLPEPIPKRREIMFVKSYCVHRSCLIIQTKERGIFGINVDNRLPKWVRLVGPSEGGKFPFRGIFAMVDRMFFNPFMAGRWGDPSPYPIQIQSPKESSCIDREIMKRHHVLDRILCVDDRCNNLCIVEDAFPCLLVHILKFDDAALQKLGSDMSNWENIHSNKSFTFALTSCHCDSIVLYDCFPSFSVQKMAETKGRRTRQMKKHLLRTRSLMKKQKRKY